MVIPYFRAVNYLDDGIFEWQCLSCYSFFACGHISNWNYCPFCGIKHKGTIETRDHEVPRWQYDLEKSNPNFKEHSCKKDIEFTQWVIEREENGVFSDSGKYTTEVFRCDVELGSSKKVKHVLESLREEVNRDIYELYKESPLSKWDTETLEDLESIKFTFKIVKAKKSKYYYEYKFQQEKEIGF